MKKYYWHWAERLADEVMKREEPYVITSGITTSGPAHLGTVCEFLYPAAIKKEIEAKGKKAEHYFIADILDAFDSIPKDMEQYKDKLEEHLGKPLCNVPDPQGCHESYGDHYLAEVIDIIRSMGFLDRINIVRVNELYRNGAFDNYALIFVRNLEKVKEILEKTSGRQLPKSYFPVMPICENCGKIATTTVIKFDLKDNDLEYEYLCDKDVGYVKGCGHRGKDKLSNHNYKLQWRLHWVAWQQYFGTVIEGGGVDHFTRGGSYDTAKALHREIFGKEPPIGYKYGFVLFGGKKYSKSKGIGMYVRDMIKIIPPSVLAYHLLKFDLEENIDFVPTKETILKVIEDYEYASRLEYSENLSRKDRKKYKAYVLAGGRAWKTSFREILMYYQIYKDWDKVRVHLSIDVDDLEMLRPYIEKWIEWGFVPEDYDFSYRPIKASGYVKEFFESLDENMDALAIHNKIYEFAKQKGIDPRELFKKIYLTLIGKERGPRAGKLIYALGVKKVKEDVL